MAVHRSFDSVLVANRGEIALRVFRTARAMGLRTVAVYSEADAGMPHARGADAAVCIGPAPAAQSYLDIGRLIAAAQRTGAQAVHPGYGFLSESAAFATACADAGLVFIGPSPQAIADMGDKARAKQIMAGCGVPCIPGYDGAEQDEATFTREAARIGWPLMVKAIGGGGGKGMRRVDAPAQLPEALRAARSEALKAFGNGALMLERAVVNPRHVEVQVFGDSHGSVVYLGDRDCSVQRRHQKVFEEAPAPGLSDDLRARMGAAAVRAAQAVAYEGAGTVEFMLDAQGDFHFLEMNTRLQVEHPVTEMCTGLDLVEWQIRIARGEPLPLRQPDIRLRGHAIEARVYAEDPAAHFLPQSGRLTVWQPPQGVGLRIDTALEAGASVSTHYDPMIAKAIAHGPDRETARLRLLRAVEGFAIGGLRHNGAFLHRCLAHPAFVAAALDTGFLEREAAALACPTAPSRQLFALAAALFQDRGSAAIAPELRHWRSRPGRPPRLDLRCGGARAAWRVAATRGGFDVGDDEGTVHIEWPAQAQSQAQGQAQSQAEATPLRLRIDGVDLAVHAAWSGDELDLVHAEDAWRFAEVAAGGAAASKALRTQVTAPMPGSIVEVRCADGSTVQAGDVVLVLEAMKMEHRIEAPASGRVRQLSAVAGQQVGMRELLFDIDTATEAVAAP
jgi:geranyl-CoA carboxylase alpha subunit